MLRTAIIIAALGALSMGALWSAQAVGETRVIHEYQTRSVEDARLDITFDPTGTHFATVDPVVVATVHWSKDENVRLSVAGNGVREGQAWSWRTDLGENGGRIDFDALREASTNVTSISWKLIITLPDSRELNAPFTFDDPLYSLPTQDAATWRFAHDEKDPITRHEKAGVRALADDPIAPATAIAGLAVMLLAWRIPA